VPKVLRIINRFNLGGPTYNVAYLSKYLSSDYQTLLVGGQKDESEDSSEFILDKLDLAIPIPTASLPRPMLSPSCDPLGRKRKLKPKRGAAVTSSFPSDDSISRGILSREGCRLAAHTRSLVRQT
jgi:hypothetical protein